MGVGASGIREPNIGAVAVSHGDRLDGIERALASQTPGQRPRFVPFDVPFSYAGALAAARSGRFYPRFSGRLTAVLFSLDTAGSTATTFKVYRSGTALTPTGVGSGLTVSSTTITITGSTNAGKAYFDHVFTVDVDYLQIEIISIGTGAKDLDAQARFG